MYVQRVKLKLLEPLFFSTREIGKTQETESVVGNYALAYAMGLVAAPYNSTRPSYEKDLFKIKDQIYITPAMFISFHAKTETFNTGSESYWYEFDKNAIKHSPFAQVKPRNFPQNGKIKMISAESLAIFYVISNEKIELPPYIRLGKFMSKTKLYPQQVKAEIKPSSDRNIKSSIPLNTLDIPPDSEITIFSYELLMMRPAPLLMNSIFKGKYYEISWNEGGKIEREYFPVGMKFLRGIGNEHISSR